MPTPNDKAVFRRDVISALLFVAAADGVYELAGFIARKQLDAPAIWIGILGSAAYWGYVWNLFFGYLTARLSLRRGLLVLMLLASVIAALGAWVDHPVLFCWVVAAFLLVLGLFEVQYNTTIRHLYDQEQRPKRLSRRRLLVSIVAALLTVAFGSLTESRGVHTAAFLIAAGLMMAGAWVFRGIPLVAEPRMEPFRAGQVAGAALRDPAMRRVVVMLLLYGWVGAGSQTLLVLLYDAKGLAIDQVSQIQAARIGGVLLGYGLLTPRLRFSGGVSNYRWCFVSAGVAMIIFFLAGTRDVGAWTFWALAAGQLCFGLSVAVFDLAMQTTGINLAPEGKTTLYVNTLLIVQGLRGIIMPLLVASVLQWWGLTPALSISLGVGVLCALIVALPHNE
jgi:hypothetical protein